ncbi:MAG: hypothetical protein LUQ38_01080 [Methanotrichaceae archaeon]|nr:hypothetical protein [Methanotrichaceae archaeon]MDD1758197.1 hypothetical protein [Methanotrichaceae archaeon]
MLKKEAENLLAHWIEHNESHIKSLRERAEQVQDISELAAQDIKEAADLMDKCNEILKRARRDL